MQFTAFRVSAAYEIVIQSLVEIHGLAYWGKTLPSGKERVAVLIVNLIHYSSISGFRTLYAGPSRHSVRCASDAS